MNWNWFSEKTIISLLIYFGYLLQFARILKDKLRNLTSSVWGTTLHEARATWNETTSKHCLKVLAKIALILRYFEPTTSMIFSHCKKAQFYTALSVLCLVVFEPLKKLVEVHQVLLKFATCCATYFRVIYKFLQNEECKGSFEIFAYTKANFFPPGREQLCLQCQAWSKEQNGSISLWLRKTLSNMWVRLCLHSCM